MTESVGWGQGDSAFYVGETPFQSKPKWTKLDHLDGYENVLGYSGTNSKYVKITKSELLQQRRRRGPEHARLRALRADAPTGIIQKNNIFWNNFNYFLPSSRVQTVSERPRPARRPDDPVPDRGRRRPARRRRLDRPQQRDLRQLQGRGAGRSPIRSTRATTRSRRTTSSSTTRWAAAAPTPTPRLLQRRLRERQLLRRQHQLDLRSERHGDERHSSTRPARRRRRRPRAPGRAPATRISSASSPAT